MKGQEHHSIGNPASPCVVEDPGGRVGLAETTQGLVGPHLYLLSAILGLRNMLQNFEASAINKNRS